MRGLALGLALGLVAAQAGPATAQPKRDPDWPCVQRLVPELAYGLVWAGAPLDPYFDTWDDDPKRAAVVRKVTRLSLAAEQATAAVRDYLQGGEAAGETAGAVLFAGIFQQINAQRRDAIAAIKRYSRGQKALLDRIAERLQQLDRLMSQEPQAPQARIDEVRRDLQLTRQVFDTRRRALSAVCEQPVLLEQRLGALQRAITAQAGG